MSAVLAGDFDYVFWLGDLNYRLDLDRGQVDTHLSQWQLQQQQRMEEREEGHQDGWLVGLEPSLSCH